MGNPTTVLLCEKSMRFVCKGLDHTREQVGAPLLLSENGPHPKFCLSGCPSMTPLFPALRAPKAMVPRELNFPGNPTPGKRETKAQKRSLVQGQIAQCSARLTHRYIINKSL